jgi:hypothetical protein
LNAINALLQESDCSEPGLVINEGLPVLVSLWTRDRQWTLQISVDKCKEGGSTCGSFGDVMAALLSKDARFADGVRGCS